MSAESGASIDARNLTVRAEDGHALVCDVSMQVAPGEVMGLVGETGSGKTLTARSLLGLLPSGLSLDAQKLELAGADVSRLSPALHARLLGTRVGFVPQNTSTYLHPLLRIRNQLCDGYLRWHRGERRGSATAKARELLLRVGIEDPDRVLASYPGALSGGMRQRVNIAMAMMVDPAVVVADEPTAALDAISRAQVADLLVGYVRERDAALLLVSHDLGFVRACCDRLAVMYAGRIVETGPCSRVVNAPAHPYTAALLAAVPRAGAEGEARLAEMPGSMPESGRDRQTCLFAPRCPKADADCHAALPAWASDPDSPEHRVLCNRVWEVGDGRPRG